MQSKIISAFSILYQTRTTIDFLFNKRPSSVGKASLFDADPNLTEARLEALIERKFIGESQGEFVLNEHLADFLEDFLEIGDANVEMLVANLRRLGQWVDYYLTSLEPKYMVGIGRVLQKIETGLSTQIIKLYKSVDDAYKTEKDFQVKLMKLENYRSDRNELLKFIENVKLFLDAHQILLASDPLLSDARTQLSFGLIRAQEHLLGLQSQIVDYINRTQFQSKFYKKLTALKITKGKTGLLHAANSNVVEVALQMESLVLKKRVVLRSKVSLETLLDNDEGMGLIEKVRARLKMKVGRIPRSEELNSITEKEFSESPRLPLGDLFELFSESGSDLFAFLQSFRFPPEFAELSPQERISLFVEMSMEFEPQLEFKASYRPFRWQVPTGGQDSIEYQVVVKQGK